MKLLIFQMSLLILSVTSIQAAESGKEGSTVLGRISSNAPTGSHGGKLLSNSNRTAEVTFRENSNHVEVYLSPNTGNNPRSVYLTLFDDKSRPLTFELKAMDSNDSSVSTYHAELNLTSPGAATPPGKYPPGTYSGIELKIPLSKGAPEILRSTPKGK